MGRGPVVGASRCLLWYGEDDAMVPVSHGRRLADLVPGADLTVLPGEGHGSVTLDHVPEILKALS